MPLDKLHYKFCHGLTIARIFLIGAVCLYRRVVSYSTSTLAGSRSPSSLTAEDWALLSRAIFSSDSEGVAENTCLRCTITFLSDEAAKSHIVESHWSEVRYILKHRGRTVSSRRRVDCEKCGESKCKCVYRGEWHCQKCQKLFKTLQGYRNHTRNHTNDWLYYCEICGKGFADKALLATHLLKHEGNKPFSCTMCEKRYFTSQGLKFHLNEIHVNPKINSCDICNKTYKTSNNLYNHMRVHTMSLESRHKHACHICGVGYIHKLHLETHLRTHTGELPFACNQCEKQFNSKAGLQLHALRHTGVKKFICDVCSKAFTLNSTLLEHRRTHTGERPFQCNICGKTFTQRSSRNTHLRRHNRADSCEGVSRVNKLQ